MSKRVTEYRVIRSFRGPAELNSAAAELLADGWQPWGSPAASEADECRSSIWQAFVRYEEGK